MPALHTLPDDVASALNSGAIGLEVPLEKIDSQLDHMFDGDKTRTRASLMNFAIYSEDPESLLRNDQLTQDITRDHACRALLIHPLKTEHERSGAKAWIRANCTLDPRGGKAVCSEQITFVLQGRSVSLVTNVVFGHLRSDLPLTFWWQGDLNSRFEERLYSLVDRLIVDSAEWEDLPDQFQRVRAVLDQSGSRFAYNKGRKNRFLLHDLAWTRGHHHRLAIAACFDDPEALHELEKVTDIEIEYHATHYTAALYMVAWISTQLGGTLKGGSKAEGAFHYERPGDAGDLKIRLVDSGPEDSPITAVILRGEHNCFHVGEAEDPDFLCVRSRVGERSHEKYTVGPPETTQDLVVEVLMRGGNNMLLRKIMPSFLELVER